MKKWYRVLVSVMALAMIFCTTAAAYVCTRMVYAGEQLLSNEMLIRTIREWWPK